VRKFLRKRRVLAGLFVLVFLAVAAWFEPTCVVRGWLCGEAFYQGRPTSYWSRELQHWDRKGFFTLLTDVSGSARGVDIEGAVTWADLDGDTVPDVLIMTGKLRGNVTWFDFDSDGYSRTPGLLDKLAGYFGIELEQPARPALLSGDPEAEPVLRELLDDPSPVVREHARRRLEHWNGTWRIVTNR
jgi:hypothetical protein